MEKPVYELVDVVQRSVENATFCVPIATARYGLCLGDCVKLIFDNKERMWLRVTEIEDEGWYQGELLNHPVIVDLHFGDTVRFHAKHVADIRTSNC